MRVCVCVCSSSNDAFTNQHSLIPPSFGGPQIQVALPRVTGIPTGESVTPASEDSLSTTQTVPSGELVAETGHDVVKELFPDSVNYQQPDDLMSVAEESSISAAGVGFDAVLRRASAPEAAEMFDKQHCISVTCVDASVAAEGSDSLHNGHMACDLSWQLLNPSLGTVASDNSVTSSVGSMLEGSSLDISGLVCRTAAVAGHSSFKTHALTDRSSDAEVDSTCGVDDSNASLTDRVDLCHDVESTLAKQQVYGDGESSIKSTDDNVLLQQHIS